MAFNPSIDEGSLRPLLDDLERLRQEIGALDPPTPLIGWLRRNVEARGAHMSTRIEGNPLTESEVRELFARHQETLDRSELENLDYRDAARFARQVANDPTAEVDAGLIRALHYLVVRSTYPFDSAAQWRTSQNRVADQHGRTVYLPPPPVSVPAQMNEFIEWLAEHRRSTPHLVLAAVAHLQFVNIHSFDDGNGRTARALTAYFLERHGWGLRGIVSSEAVFGRDRAAYYAALTAAGGRYEDRVREMTLWCEWFIRGLAVEAAASLGFVQRWTDHVAPGSGQDVNAGYAYLALAGSVSRAEYVDAMRVSPATAVNQLNALVKEGLAVREGRGRSTRYRMTEDIAGPLFDESYEEALARFSDP